MGIGHLPIKDAESSSNIGPSASERLAEIGFGLSIIINFLFARVVVINGLFQIKSWWYY